MTKDSSIPTGTPYAEGDAWPKQTIPPLNQHAVLESYRAVERARLTLREALELLGDHTRQLHAILSHQPIRACIMCHKDFYLAHPDQHHCVYCGERKAPDTVTIDDVPYKLLPKPDFQEGDVSAWRETGPKPEAKDDGTLGTSTSHGFS